MSDEQGQVLFKGQMRFAIDFKEWRKNQISRKEALYRAFFWDIRGSWGWLMAAWRGYWSGTIYNAGV